MRIYMNENLKKKNNSGPKIAIADGNKVVYVDKVWIMDKAGNYIACVRADIGPFTDALGHEVKAWIDL